MIGYVNGRKKTLVEEAGGGEQKVVGRMGRWEDVQQRDVFCHDVFVALKLTEAVVSA